MHARSISPLFFFFSSQPICLKLWKRIRKRLEYLVLMVRCCPGFFFGWSYLVDALLGVLQSLDRTNLTKSLRPRKFNHHNSCFLCKEYVFIHFQWINSHRLFQWDPESELSRSFLAFLVGKETHEWCPKKLLTLEVVWSRCYRNTVRTMDSSVSWHYAERPSFLALQGFLQGYTLTGRTGLFPSYEAFLGRTFSVMIVRTVGSSKRHLSQGSSRLWFSNTPNSIR